MSYSNELYQQIILDHNSNPFNFELKLENISHSCHGYNPFCGDDYTVSMDISNKIIRNISFSGNGCAISKASASIMLESIKSKDIEYTFSLFNSFRDYVTVNKDNDHNILSPDLEVFSNIKNYPSRIKCVILPWHTLVCALKNQKNISINED